MDSLPQLYTSLAGWWDLLSRPQDYAEEAAAHWRAITAHAQRPVRTVLELGCGGGNNAVHLKRWCQMTLSDLSPAMLEVSRRLNPQCEHVAGDMRTLRLGRRFDAVFLHDAVMYMKTRDDLAAAICTAFEHCHSGGAALFLPDFVRESFAAGTDCGGHDAGDGRGLRYLEWTWDPDPADEQYIAEMGYLLRDADGRTRVVHDRHEFGLFDRATWISLLTDAGFDPREIRCDDGSERVAFVGIRP